MCRRFCCYAYLAPTGSASHWSFEQETEEETNQRINIAFARQCNTTNVPSQSQPFWCLSRLAATSAVLHHPIRNGDRRYEHLSVPQACQRGPDQWSSRKNLLNSFVHTYYMHVCMCIYIYISIVSHLPCGHWEQDSKAMSKSWQENMELLSRARQGQPAQERHSSRVKRSIEIKCAVKRSQAT